MIPCPTVGCHQLLSFPSDSELLLIEGSFFSNEHSFYIRYQDDNSFGEKLFVVEVPDDIYYAGVDKENNYGFYVTWNKELVVFTYD